MPFDKKTYEEEWPRTLGVLIFGIVVTHGLVGLLAWFAVSEIAARNFLGGLILMFVVWLFLRSQLARDYRHMCRVRFYHRRSIKLSGFMERLMENVEPEVLYGGRSLTHEDGFVLTRIDNYTLIMTTTGTYLLGCGPVCLWSPEDFSTLGLDPFRMMVATEGELVSLLRKFQSYR